MKQTLIVSSLFDGITLRFTSDSSTISVVFEKHDVPHCQLNIFKADVFLVGRCMLYGYNSLRADQKRRISILEGQLNRIHLTLGAHDFSAQDRTRARVWLRKVCVKWDGEFLDSPWDQPCTFVGDEDPE